MYLVVASSQAGNGPRVSMKRLPATTSTSACGSSARPAERRERERMAVGDRAAAVLAHDDGRAELLGEPLQRRAAAGREHAAAGIDHRERRRLQHRGDAPDLGCVRLQRGRPRSPAASARARPRRWPAARCRAPRPRPGAGRPLVISAKRGGRAPAPPRACAPALATSSPDRGPRAWSLISCSRP